eukprot:gene10761-12551_t
MDRLAQLVYEGTRTFSEVDATIEIVVVHLHEYGLFEVLARDQNSQCELPYLYLRSSIIEQRVKAVDAGLYNSSQSTFDPAPFLDDFKSFGVAGRSSASNYILERLSLKKSVAEFPYVYVMEYVPAWFDAEAGPDRARLNQLICDNPYRYGPPPPYNEIVVEPLCFQVKARVNVHVNDDFKKPVLSPKSFSYMTHKLSSLFTPSVSPKSGDSLQREVNGHCGPHVVQTNEATGSKSRAARNLAHLSRLVTAAPDTSGEPSGDAENCHTPVTPVQLAAYFTAKGPQDGDSPRCGPYCPSPPRCLSSVPVFPSEVSLPEEWDFYGNNHTDSARPKPKSSRVHSIVPRLSFDHITAEMTAGRALRRRSLHIDVVPFEE